MSEQTENQEMSAAQEREVLKSRAEKLGVKLSGNQSNETIRALIRAKQEQLDGGDSAEPSADAAKSKMTLRQMIRERDLALVRIRVTCMDPKKAKWPGETFTVANEYLGTVRKLVPFGEATDNGFHVPLCILKAMQRRRFLQITTRRNEKGVEIPVDRYVKEFAIEILDPLTPAQLADLAKAQLAAGAIE